MSRPDTLRRADLAMPRSDMNALLAEGYAARVATVGADGWPYVVPMLYVWSEPDIYFHNSNAAGHLNVNLAANNRVCLVIDEPGMVYGYGRFECDSSISYRSVMAFGIVHRVVDEVAKAKFCDELMRKYGRDVTGRPQGVYPRLAHIDVHRVAVERLAGKRINLPQSGARWPALDRTKSA
jgi:nitroimidazol reductase NimA-like FMN-containing flavoprotein (pyridoxamine 5'-phosphate oxidase superfamily)